ncbi:MAG: AmmeMemoRadiSam system protein B [Candidatus Aenigmarchaeota archaeon]|nr:AmmeMemoRadiSam system protein B [Candidatus Aenigmarchaeota archaeon]
MREPVAEGFYPFDKKTLEDILAKFIVSSKKNPHIKGVITPHAGYVYSGASAGKVYSQLDDIYDTVILLGVNHTGVGNRVSVSLVDWETPLGVVKNDVVLGNKIINSSDVIRADELSHIYEHSIEVQLPFLQKILGDFKIVPITVSAELTPDIFKQLGASISKTIEGQKALIVASSDFTHFGKSYGFEPVEKDAVTFVTNTDRHVIDAILEKNTEKFIETARATTVCGVGSIALLMSILKNEKATLIDYKTSYDISKNKDMIVGYAGIVFE